MSDANQTEPTPGDWVWYKTGDRWHLIANQGLRPCVLTANADQAKTICEECGAEVYCLGPPYLTSRLASHDLLKPLDPQHPDARVIGASKDLLACLKVTAAMLAYEAQCHEESGDPKRRSYVDPLRKQVEAAQQLIAKAKGEAT